MELRGRWVLVTGAARRVGRCIALELGRRGAHVVVHYNTSGDEAAATVAALPMACGTPVVGADAPGIREIITHKVNGVLCGTSAQEIHSELAALLGDAPLRAAISAGGVDYVRRTCSLDAVAALELQLLQSL